jgi:quinoprotein glucose dehydrogenase
VRFTLVSLLALTSLAGAPAGKQERPVSVADPELMAKRLKLAPGLKVELWAKEPEIQNPVAFAFDERGRMFVAECFRRHTSLLDIHMRKEWLDDDLACRKHEDLVAYHQKRMGDRAGEWTKESERIRILEDKDGDGKAETATTFSEGYNALGEGIGAGVLVRRGEVWYTCIPNLWSLKDTDGDGKADVKKAMFTGFGVHLGASGHDMHGLRFGPDGKLYWSHGDRGFHVEHQGRTYSFPDGGGVLRCNPDGSDLEVVCVGLRNPQELAFDQYGNLFTGDNNISIAPDVGETCRWTHVVEGADYGWRIGYQFMPKGGAWCAEDQWKLEAAYQVPPVARLGHGPSGVTYHPGVAAIPERYQDHFFMCDYPGGIYAFQMKPKGATFEMVGLHRLAWEISTPDVEFGNDGALYVADWVGLWDKVDKGRIWKLSDPEAKDPAIAEVKKLIAEGMTGRSTEQVAAFLRHRDQRVRQAAQFELASRKAHFTLVKMLAPEEPQLARIHAIWGMGQVRRERELVPLLDDADPEIRAQAAKVLGDLRSKAAYDRLVALLGDASPRVRYFATIGLGKIGRRDALPAVLDLLRKNTLGDRVLQHAGIMALAWMGDVDPALSKDPSVAVRLAALVALRKLRRPELARFLSDPDPRVVLEAARAIYDESVDPAYPELAKLLGDPKAPERALLRAANAAFRLGDAKGLATFAARKDMPASARTEALQILSTWESPSGRDRLMGIWRPVPSRDPREAREALASQLGALLAGDVAPDATRAASALKLEDAGAVLRGVFRDASRPPATRAAALAALGELGGELGEDVSLALESPEEAILREGARLVPKAKLGGGAAKLEKLAGSEGPLTVRQAAVTALGAIGADEALGSIFDRGAPPALQLELLEAAAGRPALKERVERFEAGRKKDDPLAAWRETLEGGDPAAGRAIFLDRRDVQCIRCHKLAGEGGEVGAPLEKIGSLKPREYLLESLVDPNKTIAEGWGQTAFQLANDSIEVGRIEKENDADVVLVLADGLKKTIAKKDVKARKAGLSAMPQDLIKPLSKRDVRDLVAFLASLK